MDESQLLNEAAAAQYVSMSVAYLQRARCKGTTGNRTPGPAYLKLGRTIKYRQVDLDNWLLSNRVEARPNLKQPTAAAPRTHAERPAVRDRRSPKR